MKHQCGVYRGIRWARRRICDVLTVDVKARWYFADGIDDGSDHFKTQSELFRFIDSHVSKKCWGKK